MTDEVMAWTFPAGKLITNFATLGAVATITFTVPAGKRWLFLDGRAERDANATMDAKITDGTNDMVLATQLAAGVTDAKIGAMFASLPQVMDAGWEMIYTWGVAQTTPEVTCLVLEIDI